MIRSSKVTVGLCTFNVENVAVGVIFRLRGVNKVAGLVVSTVWCNVQLVLDSSFCLYLFSIFFFYCYVPMQHVPVFFSLIRATLSVLS